MPEIKCKKCGSNKLFAQTEALRESFQVEGAWIEARYRNPAGKAHVYCMECWDDWWMNIQVVPKIVPLLSRARHYLEQALRLAPDKRWAQRWKKCADSITGLIGEDD